MENLLNQLSHLEHWKIAVLATGMLLQGAIGTIFPEEIILTSLGVLWSQGKIGFIEAWAAGLLGLLPANALPALLGRKLGLRALSKKPLSQIFKKDAVENSLALIKRHGTRVIFFTRFLPLIRGPIYFATGVAQISALQFSKADALAACIQIPLLIIIGGIIGRNADSLIEAYRTIGLSMLLVIGLVALSRVRLRSRFRQKASSPNRSEDIAPL